MANKNKIGDQSTSCKADGLVPVGSIETLFVSVVVVWDLGVASTLVWLQPASLGQFVAAITFLSTFTNYIIIPFQLQNTTENGDQINLLYTAM